VNKFQAFGNVYGLVSQSHDCRVDSV